MAEPLTGCGKSQQHAQDAGACIELGGFAQSPRLGAPHRKTGSNALSEPDHEEAEHKERNEQFEQSETALLAERVAVGNHGL